MDIEDTYNLEDQILKYVEDGEIDMADQLLDDSISSLVEDIAVTKRSKYPEADDNGLTGSGQDNARGHQRRVRLHDQQPDNSELDDESGEAQPDDEEAEDNVGKRFVEAEEAKVVKGIELELLDNDVSRITKIAAMSDASGAHDLRTATIQKTLDDLEHDMARVSKLGSSDGRGSYSPFNVQAVRYPHGEGEQVLQHNRVVQPGSTETFPDRSQRSVVPSVQPAGQHAFDVLVDQLVAQNGGSRAAAFTATRLLHPSAYLDYVNWRSSTSSQAQQANRSDLTNQVNKNASYKDLVADEMIRKGVNERVAMQRLSHRGIMPSDASIAKANDDYYAFREHAQDLVEEGSQMPRTSALRKARYSRPELYKSLSGCR
jgi:hypothetical protein